MSDADFLQGVADYARAYDVEDIRPIAEAAEEYITGAIEQKDKGLNREKPLYCLAVQMLASHWYDNREPVGQANKLSYGLEAIMVQLQNGVKS